MIGQLQVRNPYFMAYKAQLFASETALSCALRLIQRFTSQTKFVWQKLICENKKMESNINWSKPIGLGPGLNVE
jgi:hypothetical protein